MSYSKSILTEDYVNKFNECALPGLSHISNPAQNFKSDIDQDSLFITDDMETKSFNQIDDYNYLESSPRPLEFDEKDALNVERKYQEILKKRRNKTDNYLTPTFKPSPSLYDDKSKPQDDQSTIYDDFSWEIQHKKSEILKGLELERQERGRKSSLSRNILRNDINLPLHNTLKHLSPRESLQQRVLDLDQLSLSVQKANFEHQRLCQEVEEMQNELRKNQAEVRLSERITQNNREKIEDINKELKTSEHRRDQTLRQLELVTEELNLKKAKMKTLDGQISRERAGIRQMAHNGIDKEEIENILKERDELYNMVKKQEDIQLEKFQVTKELEIVKGDFLSEQEKSKIYIQNLEDDLEASLRMIKEVQFEKKELEFHLEHLRQHLDMAEGQASKSAREVSELKDDYHSKIRKKLDEYEQDKEKVEKELKKLEEEKTLDENILKNHIEKIRSELKITEKERKEFKNKIVDLEDQVRKGSQSKQRIIEEHDIRIKHLQNEKDEVLHRLKKEIIIEQRLLLKEQEIQFGYLRNKLQKECDNEIENLMITIQLKDQEVLQISDQLRQTENEMKLQSEKIKADYENQLRREKCNWEQHHITRKKNEIHKIKDDYECQIRVLKNEFEKMNSSLDEKETQIILLKNEIVDAKLENKNVFNKNMLQLRNVKEGVRQDTIKQLKQKYEQKMERELMKIISEMEKKSDAKLTKIVDEKCLTEESEKRNKQILVKIVKTVAHEINEECRKISALLNVHPRRVNHSNVSDDFSKSDNIITQALANLEACGYEIRNLVEELEAKVDSLNSHINKTEINMEKEIKSIRCDLEREKAKDVECIREKLMKEHLREIQKLAKSPDIGLSNLLREKENEITKLKCDRESWKEKAMMKLAEKFDKHHQKKINELRSLLIKREKELRQLKAIRGKSSSLHRRESRSSSALNLEGKNESIQSSPAKIILNLKESLGRLRNENNELRQRISNGDTLGRKSRLDHYKGSLLNISPSDSKSRER